MDFRLLKFELWTIIFIFEFKFEVWNFELWTFDWFELWTLRVERWISCLKLYTYCFYLNFWTIISINEHLKYWSTWTITFLKLFSFNFTTKKKNKPNGSVWFSVLGADFGEPNRKKKFQFSFRFCPKTEPNGPNFTPTRN